MVSGNVYNNAPGTEYIWIVPAAPGGGGLAVEALEHVARTDLDEEELNEPDQDHVRRVLDFVRWGIFGDEPFYAAPEPVLSAHRAALERPARFDQGDIVHDGDDAYIVISGRAFNTVPETGVIWTIPIGPENTLHPERVFAFDTGRLDTPRHCIPQEDLRALLEVIRRILD
ncbi:hypothetical protein DP939_07740 [Spongiactinospora rosea]|uniref:Uncharacterized protein n=1 Tax=Spongiactinospora rosea TaxID=2248750 RepID=A0A366M418_9ACTN|nr:hypothetical protein DP939_07740 [Spongiactinospora rosea]